MTVRRSLRSSLHALSNAMAAPTEAERAADDAQRRTNQQRTEHLNVLGTRLQLGRVGHAYARNALDYGGPPNYDGRCAQPFRDAFPEVAENIQRTGVKESPALFLQKRTDFGKFHTPNRDYHADDVLNLLSEAATRLLPAHGGLPSLRFHLSQRMKQSPEDILAANPELWKSVLNRMEWQGDDAAQQLIMYTKFLVSVIPDPAWDSTFKLRKFTSKSPLHNINESEIGQWIDERRANHPSHPNTWLQTVGTASRRSPADAITFSAGSGDPVERRRHLAAALGAELAPHFNARDLSSHALSNLIDFQLPLLADHELERMFGPLVEQSPDGTARGLLEFLRDRPDFGLLNTAAGRFDFEGVFQALLSDGVTEGTPPDKLRNGFLLSETFPVKTSDDVHRAETDPADPFFEIWKNTAQALRTTPGQLVSYLAWANAGMQRPVSPVAATSATGPAATLREAHPAIRRLVGSVEGSGIEQQGVERLRDILETVPASILARVADTGATFTVGTSPLSDAQKRADPKRLAVWAFWENGKLRIDPNEVLQEIGRGFDVTPSRTAGLAHLHAGFATAFAADAQKLPPELQGDQPRAFAHVFARSLLDPERCRIETPALAKHFETVTQGASVNGAALEASVRASEEKPVVSVSNDVAGFVALKEAHAARSRELGIGAPTYFLALEGTPDEASHGLVRSLASDIRNLRGPDRARCALDEGIVHIDAATFNDPRAFKTRLESISNPLGAVLSFTGLANISADSESGRILDAHLTRHGGKFPVVFTGTRKELEGWKKFHPKAEVHTAELGKLDGEQMVEVVLRDARAAGCEFEPDARIALLARGTKPGTTAEAHELWNTLVTNQRNRRSTSGADWVGTSSTHLITRAAVDALPVPEDKSADAALKEIVGMTEVLGLLNGLISNAQLANELKEHNVEDDYATQLNVMIEGPPGSGKTTIANIITRVLFEKGLVDGDDSKVVSASSLMKGNPVENIEELFNPGGVPRKGAVIIDEAHQLNDTPEGRRALRSMIDKLDNKDYLRTPVFFLGYEGQVRTAINAVDPGGEGRFAPLQTHHATMEQLGEILDRKVGKMKFAMTPEARTAALEELKRQKSRNKRFANGRAVVKLLDRARLQRTERLTRNSIDRKRTVEELTTFEASDFNVEPKVSREEADRLVAGLTGFDSLKKHLRTIDATMELAEALEEDPFEDVSSYFFLREAPGTSAATVIPALSAWMCSRGFTTEPKPQAVSALDLQAGYVGQTGGSDGKASKLLDASTGKLLYLEKISALADAGGAFKKEGASELARAMSKDRGSFALVIAGTEEDFDAFVGLDPEFGNLFSHRVELEALDSSEASGLVFKLIDSKKLTVDQEVSAAVNEGVEVLRNAVGFAGQSDADRLVGKIKAHHASAFTAARAEGLTPNPKQLAATSVASAVKELLGEKLGEQRAVKKAAQDDLDAHLYASEVKAAQATGEGQRTAERPKLELSEQDYRTHAAIQDVDSEFRKNEAWQHEMLAHPQKAEGAMNDTGSRYVQALAKKLGVSAEKAVAMKGALEEKKRQFVEFKSLQKVFKYTCPYCGLQDSAPCMFINESPEWKRKHSTTPPYDVVITQRVEVDASGGGSGVDWN